MGENDALEESINERYKTLINASHVKQTFDEFHANSFHCEKVQYFQTSSLMTD